MKPGDKRPRTWATALLPQIATINMGQSPASADVNEEGQGIVFFQGKAEFGKLNPVPRKYCTAPRKVAEAGNILLSVRAPVGPTNVADQMTAIGRGLAAIQPLWGIDGKFLLYYFRAIEPWLSEQGTGTTFKAISGNFLKELPVLVPSSAEQKQIADRLDELLARVDSIKTRLDAIPAILKRFRQSVLAAAVSGRLTEDWRRNQSAKAKSLVEELKSVHQGKKRRSNAAKPTHGVHDLGPDDIPLDWEIASLEECCAPERPITYGILKPGPDVEGGIPYIKVRDYPNDQLISGGFMRTSPQIADQYQRSVLNSGDLLLSIRGTVGRIVEIPDSLTGANITQDSARISLSELVNRRYVLWYLRSPVVQARMNAARKGVAVKGINIGDVRALQIALPDVSEQQEIVNYVEQLFDLASEVERSLCEAQKRVDKLSQSILAKAFSGGLTEDWRKENYELINGLNSSSALLEKIQEEKLRSALPSRKSRKVRKRSAVSPKRSALMTKSRHDEDVWHQPYLSSIAKQGTTLLTVEALFQKSGLPVEDFYKQLAWEIDFGHLSELSGEQEAI